LRSLGVEEFRGLGVEEFRSLEEHTEQEECLILLVVIINLLNKGFHPKMTPKYQK